MKIFLSIFFFISINPLVFSQQKLETKDSLAIIDILNKQQKDWNSETAFRGSEKISFDKNIISRKGKGPPRMQERQQ